MSVARAKIEKMLSRLKLLAFTTVDEEGRVLSFHIDEKEKQEQAKLDGCYVIKTELKRKKVSAAIIHQRYKDLALVEQGFRTIKTGLLETRPIYVRKEKRTRGHVLVVMLAYIIVHELQNLWAEEDLTVHEAVTELSTLSSDEIKIGEDASLHQIPQPRDLVEKLLNLSKVVLPGALPCRNIKVTTTRKLTSRRKRK